MLRKILSYIAIIIISLCTFALAGTFSPTPSSPASSQYTLDNISLKISSSTFSGVTQGVHSFTPVTVPNSTFITLTDVWNSITWKTLNNSGTIDAGFYATTSLVTVESNLTPSKIASGTSIFGVNGSCLSIISFFRQNLIGFWSSNGDTNDNSGTSNNASWTIGSPVYAAGKFGQALSFDGSSEVSLNMNNMPAQEIFSVSVWAKASRLTMRNGQMIGWGDDWSNNTFALMIGGADSYGDVMSNQLMILNGYWKATGYFLNDLNWHNFTATADGVTLKVYVDGVKVPNDLTSDGVMSSFVHLGHFPGGYYQSGQSGAPFLRFYYGLVDESTIWNRTLSPSEILDLYNIGAGRNLYQ